MGQRSPSQPDPSRSPGAVRGWVLYDGQCGVCRSLVPRWARSLRGRGFAITPLQEPWVVECLRGLGEDPFRDFRLLLADGRLLTGAEVYRYLLRDRWWTRPLYWLTRLPILSWLFDAAYRRFADNRHRISSSCGLEPPPSTAEGPKGPVAVRRGGEERA